MLHGQTIILRELRRADLEVLHKAFDSDPAVHALVSPTPWVPVPVERRQALFDERLTKDKDGDHAVFAVQRRDDPQDRCLGTATLWGMDAHNRSAHVGVMLVAAARGHGVGREAVSLICEYAFAHRDLHRVQLDTLGANEPMQAVAKACGFTLEGRRREAAFVVGERDDEVVFGLLARQWWAARGRP